MSMRPLQSQAVAFQQQSRRHVVLLIPPRVISSSGAHRRFSGTRFLRQDSKSNGATPASGSASARAAPRAKDSPRPTTIAIPGPAWLWMPLKPLKYPLNAYNRAQSKRPYLTQFVSSLIIYFLGDLSSQLIQQPAPTVDPISDDLPPHLHNQSQPAARTQAEGQNTTPNAISRSWEHYDPTRSLRACVIGGLFSIPSYHWFLYLSGLFPTYTHIPRLACQVIIAQIVFAPFFNSYFFGMQALLSYKPKHNHDTVVKDGEDGEDGKAEGAWTLDAKVRVEDAWDRICQTVPVSWWNSCKFWPVVTAFSFTFVEPRSRSVFAGIVAIGWQTYLGLVNQRAVEAQRRTTA